MTSRGYPTLVSAVNDASFRQTIRDTLDKWNASTEAAIRRELAASFDLGHSGRLQFEIDGIYYGITLVQTEEVVLEDSICDAMPEGVLDEAEAAGIDWLSVVVEELVQWFADRWCAADGPSRYRPAYAFFHGGLNQPRYDLARRRWCPVDEVWPDTGVG